VWSKSSALRASRVADPPSLYEQLASGRAAGGIVSFGVLRLSGNESNLWAVTLNDHPWVFH
jgi:hypothetical protein